MQADAHLCHCHHRHRCPSHRLRSVAKGQSQSGI